MLTLNMAASAFASDQTHSIMFDFEQNDAGFTSIYADYPNNEGVEEFYDLKNEYTDVPIDGAGKGLYISGNNHCDDLFMGYVKKLSGFSPEKHIDSMCHSNCRQMWKVVWLVSEDHLAKALR